MDDHNMTQGQDMMNMTMPMNMNMSMGHEMSYMHMTFYWGKDSAILFSGWPGSSTGMYVLALVVVFVLAVILEWLGHCPVPGPHASHVASGLVRTALHTARVALAYIVMLALMSFNVGVLLVAVAGHGLGFLLFGSSVFRPPAAAPVTDVDRAKAGLPPMAC
ncbi:hypothetical protein J5N97_011099 [Dioscorea zingiberensis]|uniref:Copper transport protein n=1 Tax=Dioscorea zingiberensis TaxID=325984 RepID=A0A9D5D1G9_9LILI|nr:hypothetical protein J5N97_011099 [Dioscorea zingiberensis]